MCVQQHGKIQINSSARHDDTFSAAAAAVAHAHMHAAEMVNPVVAVAHHQQTTTTTLLLAPSTSQQQQQQTHHQHHHSLLSAIPQNFLGQQLQQQHRSGPATVAAAAATTAAAAAAAKSNPSKRHRERLNGQLECLATLLPFEASVITKLDKLSILRLSVSFLRVKSYFHSLPLLMKEPTLPASSSSALAQRHSSSLHHLSSSSSSSATAAAHLYHQQQYQQQQQQQQFYYNAIQPHSSYTAYSNATHSQQHHLQHLYQHQQRNETDFQQQYQHYAAAAAAAVAASSSGGGGSSSSAAGHSQPPHSYHQYEASAANRLIAAGLSPEVLSRDSIMQALNGFLFIVQADGEVFYVTRTVEHYLGFHQSDILHQSVFDLVHSEDRHEFQKQLSVLLPGVPLLPPATTTSPTDPSPPAAVEAAANSFPTSFNDLVCSGNIHLLERNFTARFRCLLDNTSGFTRMEVRGRIGTLQGHKMRQTHASSASSTSTASSSLAFSQHTALFALCSPFGPPAMLELVARESLFRSKHKMDLEFINMDAKGKSVLGCFYNPNLNPANVGTSAAAAGKQNGSKFDTLTADFENATATKQTAAAAKRENAKKDKTARNLVDTGTNETRHSASIYDPNADHGDSKVSTLPQIEGKKLYNLIHPDDLRYVMSGHSELLKTGTTGLLAYRVQADVDMPWHWLQSSLRINYKSGRGEFIIATHRALIEEEGKDLLTKRCIAVAFSNLLEYVPNDYPPNTNATATAQQLAATGSSFLPAKADTGSSSTTSTADAAQTAVKTSENSAAGNKSPAKQQQATSNVDAATRLIRNRSMNKRPRTTTTTTSTSTSTATTTTTPSGAASSSSSAYVTRGKSSLSLANDAANSYETAAAALQHTFHGQSAVIGADYLGNSDTLTSANHQSATTFYNIGGKLYSAAQTPSLSSSSLSPYSTTHHNNNNNEATMQAAAAAAAAAAGFIFPNNNNNGSSSSTQTTAAAAAAAAKYSQMLAYQQQQQQQPHYQQDRAANYYALTGYGQHHHHQYSSATSTAQQQPFYAAVEAAQQQQQDNGNETDHQNYETEPHNHSSSTRYAAANGGSGGASNSNTNAAAWTSFGNYFNTLSYHQQQQQQQQAHGGSVTYAADNATSTTALSAAAVYNPANSYSYYAMTGARNVAGSSSGVDGFTNTSGSSSGSSGAASSSMPTAALDVESLKSAIVNNGECPVLAITNGV